MHNLLFSITIPAYKRLFLYEAIDSCLAQTYKNFELIIVDDASPEDIKGIVDRFDDQRIRYYRNEKNCGAINVVDNWNICLSYARGEYIICMGDDDRLLPCCLEEYARLIEEYPEIGLLHGWTEIIDEHSQITELSAPRPLWESAYSVAWNRWENRHHQYIGDWCFEIEWLRKQGGFYKLPLAWSSDDITAIIGALKNGVVNSQKPCFQYRNHSSTITTNGGNSSIKVDAVRMEREWFEKFLAKEPMDKLDCIYRKMFLNNMQKHFERKYGTTIAWDLNSNNIFRIFRYYRFRKEYGYTRRALGYAIQSWIRYKIKCIF